MYTQSPCAKYAVATQESVAAASAAAANRGAGPCASQCAGATDSASNWGKRRKRSPRVALATSSSIGLAPGRSPCSLTVSLSSDVVEEEEEEEEESSTEVHKDDDEESMIKFIFHTKSSFLFLHWEN